MGVAGRGKKRMRRDSRNREKKDEK